MRLPFETGKISLVRFKGNVEQQVVCPPGWKFKGSLSDGSFFNEGAEVQRHLEFLRTEGRVDVYRDRRTGQELYVGRTTSAGPMLAAGAPAGPPPQEGKLQQELQQMHSEASSLLLPYLGPSVRPEAVEDLDRLRRACELLERINALSPSHWRIWWSLGMARRRLKDRQGAYAAFQRAYRLQPDVVETGRNLFAECADLGYGEEALRLSKAILQLAPDDPGVVSNHAVALLINGDLDGAMEAVKHASSLDPQGQTTINLRNFLEEIRAGRIPVPTRIDTW